MEHHAEPVCLLAFILPVLAGAFPGIQDTSQGPLHQEKVQVEIVEAKYDLQFVDSIHGRHQRSLEDMPSSLHFRVRFESRELNVRVRRSSFRQNKDGKADVPDFPVFIIENGRIKRKEFQHDPGVRLYSNQSTCSSFLVKKRSNISDFILNGVFYEGLDQLSLTTDPDGDVHRIHKQTRVVDFLGDYVSSVHRHVTRQPDAEKTNENPGKSHVRTKREVKDENEVQLFMIADNKDYRTWFKYYRHNSTLTQMEMNLYYAFVANSMNVRYSSIKNVDSSFSLEIVITGLLIVNLRRLPGEEAVLPWTLLSQEVSSWTENNLDPSTHSVDAVRALESFRLWIKSAREDLPPSDHWMLFTGFDISTEGNKNVAGLAKLGGMCSQNSISLIEQDNTGSVGATAAHELGHSLSAVHDGEEKDCQDEDNYIMSRKLKTPDAELLASRPWQFSPCSVRAFKRFISESKCTHKAVRGLSVLSTSKNPGQVFSADLQCLLALGNGSYFGRSLQLREGYPSLCRRLWCAVPDDPGYYQGIFPLENTSCGNGKWCQKGKCVDDHLAPRMEDTCPQGDDPTAPCVLEHCPYYTNRTKLVYCCHTCRTLSVWLEHASSEKQVIRQINASPDIPDQARTISRDLTQVPRHLRPSQPEATAATRDLTSPGHSTSPATTERNQAPPHSLETAQSQAALSQTTPSQSAPSQSAPSQTATKSDPNPGTTVVPPSSSQEYGEDTARTHANTFPLPSRTTSSFSDETVTSSHDPTSSTTHDPTSSTTHDPTSPITHDPTSITHDPTSTSGSKLSAHPAPLAGQTTRAAATLTTVEINTTTIFSATTPVRPALLGTTSQNGRTDQQSRDEVHLWTSKAPTSNSPPTERSASSLQTPPADGATSSTTSTATGGTASQFINVLQTDKPSSFTNTATLVEEVVTSTTSRRPVPRTATHRRQPMSAESNLSSERASSSESGLSMRAKTSGTHRTRSGTRRSSEIAITKPRNQHPVNSGTPTKKNLDQLNRRNETNQGGTSHSLTFLSPELFTLFRFPTQGLEFVMPENNSDQAPRTDNSSQVISHNQIWDTFYVDANKIEHVRDSHAPSAPPSFVVTSEEVVVTTQAAASSRFVYENSNRLVTENSSGLVSENARGLVSENARGLVSEDSKGLVSENSSGLVSENSSRLVSWKDVGSIQSPVDVLDIGQMIVNRTQTLQTSVRDPSRARSASKTDDPWGYLKQHLLSSTSGATMARQLHAGDGLSSRAVTTNPKTFNPRPDNVGTGDSVFWRPPIMDFDFSIPVLVYARNLQPPDTRQTSHTTQTSHNLQTPHYVNGTYVGETGGKVQASGTLHTPENRQTTDIIQTPGNQHTGHHLQTLANSQTSENSQTIHSTLTANVKTESLQTGNSLVPQMSNKLTYLDIPPNRIVANNNRIPTLPKSSDGVVAAEGFNHIPESKQEIVQFANVNNILHSETISLPSVTDQHGPEKETSSGVPGNQVNSRDTWNSSAASVHDNGQYPSMETRRRGSMTYDDVHNLGKNIQRNNNNASTKHVTSSNSSNLERLGNIAPNTGVSPLSHRPKQETSTLQTPMDNPREHQVSSPLSPSSLISLLQTSSLSSSSPSRIGQLPEASRRPLRCRFQCVYFREPSAKLLFRDLPGIFREGRRTPSVGRPTLRNRFLRNISR